MDIPLGFKFALSAGELRYPYYYDGYKRMPCTLVVVLAILPIEGYEGVIPEAQGLGMGI